MPYNVNQNNYSVSVSLPQNLAHKPVYAVPYETFDGMNAGNTDAKYLSVGLSQWDPYELSVKAMRHTGGQWSPQAEELPLHRPIDMSILVARSLFDTNNGSFVINGGTFQNQSNCINVSQENRTAQEILIFDNFVKNNEHFIKERLNSLCDVLLDLRRKGKL